MNDLLYAQFKILFIFCLAGLTIGIVFDLFRIQRRAIRTHDIITCIQDILFWIISGIIVIYTTVQYTDGEIRSYMVIGLFAGIFIYFVVISRFIMNFTDKILKFFKCH